MTYSKTINDNFIFSICAILIYLRHDGLQFITHLDMKLKYDPFTIIHN